MTIPVADNTPSGVLDVVSHYFEFLPEEEADEAHEPPGTRLSVVRERPPWPVRPARAGAAGWDGRGGPRHPETSRVNRATSRRKRSTSTAPYQRTVRRPSGRCFAAGSRRPESRSASHWLPSRAGQFSGTQPNHQSNHAGYAYKKLV